MGAPSDGMGLYEQIRPDLGSTVWTPRLQQIAAGGFKLVLNYSLLYGHVTDIVSYINTANSFGLKVIVALHDPVLLNGANWGAKYTSLYADANSSNGISTTNGRSLCQYVVNQVQSLPGTWGYYVFDEPANDTTTHGYYKTNTDAIKLADSSHPRLGVMAGTGGVSFWQNISIYNDCCDVCADDWYVLNYTSANNLGWILGTTGNLIAAGIQSYANAHTLQSGIVLQAFNANEYSSQICSPWPSCATFPNMNYMYQSVQLAQANMTPRVILWYSFFDLLNSDNPTRHWNELIMAANNLQASWL